MWISQQITANFFGKETEYVIIFRHFYSDVIIKFIGDIMNERIQKNSAEKTEKKDRYSVVLICQIVAVCFLSVSFFLTVKGNSESYEQLKILLSRELFSVSDIVSSVKTYLGGDNPWAVSGDNMVYLPTQVEKPENEVVTDTQENTSEINQEILNGVGGEDIKLYQATDITSFAPIKSTSPAVAPVENGRYTSYFGYRVNPITDEFSFHTGLDIAAPQGTKIRSVYNGVVTRIGEDDRAGKFIFVTHHDGYVTFYCHCSEILAEVGAVIRQSETIAEVGSTGWSKGPHLHFEVRKDNIRYNPLHILDK